MTLPFDPNIHHRRSIRLKDYDYSQAGAYFVTLVVWQRECLFGVIEAGHFNGCPAGKIVEEAWLWLAEQYDYVQLDEFCVMPNHFHGILIITDIRRGGSLPCLSSAGEGEPPLPQENHWDG